MGEFIPVRELCSKKKKKNPPPSITESYACKDAFSVYSYNNTSFSCPDQLVQRTLELLLPMYWGMSAKKRFFDAYLNFYMACRCHHVPNNPHSSETMSLVSSYALRFMPEAQSDTKVVNFPLPAGKAASVKSAKTGLLPFFSCMMKM